MMNNSKIGLALVGGYLLGRTRKAKMAIGLGMFLAGKKLDINPQQLVRMVANSPVAGQLSDQVRKDLVDNTKSALTSALTQRAGSLADTLHERTLDMNDPSRRAKQSEGAEDADDAEERDEDGREEREERPRARRTAAASGRTAKSARTAESTGSSASANGRSASARRGGASGGGARKTASSGARKATGGARRTAAKTASGGARKVTDRGGGDG